MVSAIVLVALQRENVGESLHREPPSVLSHVFVAVVLEMYLIPARVSSKTLLFGAEQHIEGRERAVTAGDILLQLNFLIVG